MVEDEELVLDLISRTLEMAGHTVITAKSGAEVREKSAEYQGNVDLLITDVIISGNENGAQIAKYMGTRYASIKILYISGYADNAIVHHGILDTGINFLPKPFSPAALLDKIHKILAIEDQGE